jgi:hypothetical protein
MNAYRRGETVSRGRRSVVERVSRKENRRFVTIIVLHNLDVVVEEGRGISFFDSAAEVGGDGDRLRGGNELAVLEEQFAPSHRRVRAWSGRPGNPRNEELRSMI